MLKLEQSDCNLSCVDYPDNPCKHIKTCLGLQVRSAMYPHILEHYPEVVTEFRKSSLPYMFMEYVCNRKDILHVITYDSYKDYVRCIICLNTGHEEVFIFYKPTFQNFWRVKKQNSCGKPNLHIWRVG